jgi:hypothetical protein
MSAGPSWTNRYVAFVDPAGGSGGDSMALAISHHDRGADKVMLDVLREARPPFNPERVVEEFAEVLDRYRVRVVVGDRYGGDWPATAFKRRSIIYKPADRTRSDIYRDVLPLLTSGAVELLDDARLTPPARAIATHDESSQGAALSADARNALTASRASRCASGS